VLPKNCFHFDYKHFFSKHIIEWHYKKLVRKDRPVRFIEVTESVGGGRTQTGKVTSGKIS